jgi:hypothetical protein
MDQGNGMKWRVLLELTETGGDAQTHEIILGNRATSVASPETVGLTLAEAKSVLAALQTQLVQAQADGYCDRRRTCAHCGSSRTIKDWRARQLTTLFGIIRVKAPRFNPCRCGVASARIVSPLTELMPDRCTQEYERVLVKMGSLTAYGRAVALMAEFLPLGHRPAIETARRRTLEVGARLEQQLLAAKPLTPPPPAQSIAVSLDGGHVKSIRSYQMRSFEILLACASNNRGEQRLFSSVPVEADRQRQQLSAVLRDIGATPATQVTVLSDGAEGPRCLGETASQSLTRHVLDCFHLSMRVQHVAQTARSWPRGTKEDLLHGDELAKKIERIRWRLWHGRPQGALDLIDEILEELRTPKRQKQLSKPYLKKLTGVLVDLETYVSRQAPSIINYAAARRSKEPISTAPTESAVHRLLHRRMTAKQQMRWSPRGAHFMLKVRTAVINGTFERDHIALAHATPSVHRRAA